MIPLLLLLSYLLGSIPFALIVGKKFFNKDIREHGSGNLGGTNALRVLGKKAGLLVIVGDTLKGTLAASLPYLFHTPISPVATSLLAVIGHCYPVFANFRGGKAVATTAGSMIILLPYGFIWGFIAFIGCLKMTKYVSASSILAALVIFLVSLWQRDISIVIYTAAIVLFIVYKHKANIARIRNNTEPKVKWI